MNKITTDGHTEESTEVPALTPSIGFVFELNHVMQAGMFCGWDFIAHTDELNFIYHGKTWFSFGLGYSLISLDEDKNITAERKNPEPFESLLFLNNGRVFTCLPTVLQLKFQYICQYCIQW